MVISRTPLRVSFVGGGTDLPSFTRRDEGAVVSVAIDKYVHVVATSRFEEDIRVSYSQTEIVDRVDDLRHELVREALRAVGLTRAIEIVTIADVPGHGSGLGSSSAVTVGTLNALYAHLGRDRDQSELAEEASRLEIDVLGKPIGRQDQYACAFGGLQLLRFGEHGAVTREPLELQQEQLDEFRRTLLLFFTGRQRRTEPVLADVNARVELRQGARSTLARMRDLALAFSKELTNGASPATLGSYLHENWELKRTLSSMIADDEIDRWYGKAQRAGAIGGKLLGAGGGGFLLLSAPADRHESVRAALAPLRELPVGFDASGTRITYRD